MVLPTALLPSRPSGARYVQRNLYLSQRFAYLVRKMAVKEDWQMADLARAMIVTGLVVRELTETRNAQKERLRSLAEVMQAVGGRRAYAFRAPSGRGVWVTVHLPTGFLDHVAKYGQVHGNSQNETLTHLLRDGLLCYLTANKRFRETCDEEVAESRAMPPT